MSGSRRIEDRINTWVQIVGIVIAAIWGAYTFIYKEIWVPEHAPVNITMNVQVHAADGSTAKREGLIPMIIAVSASNPSTRPLTLFHTIWLAYGYKVKAREALDFATARKILNLDALEMESRDSENLSASLVAVGRLFEDEVLEPKEKIERTEILFVPPARYEALEVAALVPSAANSEDLSFEWSLDDANGAKPVVIRRSTGRAADAAFLDSHGYSTSIARTKIAF